MKEQCLEALQRNDTIPDDIANAIKNNLCINDCSRHGTCYKGRKGFLYMLFISLIWGCEEDTHNVL